MKKHVFTYGSLMFSPVWNTIVTGKYDSQTAYIDGYQRKQVVGERYPALVETHKPNTPIKGVLYLNVSASDLRRLDVFEGSQYRRTTEKVKVENGEYAVAEVYLWKNSFAAMLSTKDWSESDFESRGLRQFLKHYKGFS